jgi:hypothetical protein
MGTLGRLLTLLVVGALLLAWVAICGAAFWFLYNGIVLTQPDRGIDAVEGMMWPFTVVMIGIPLMALMAFGGLRAIRELVELQKMVAGFPRDIEAMQSAVNVFRSIKDELIAVRGQIVTEINLASSEIGQTQTEVAQQSVEGEANADVPQYVRDFEAMYQKAKRAYKAAVRRYSQRHPEDADFNAGGDWIEIVKFLRDRKEGYFDEGRNKDVWYANWIIRMVETERTTRRNRIGRLTPELVADLADDQQPPG